jgi:alpha-galactosidase
MDYGLLRRTDIAWLSDETEPSYRVRYHVYGASYPFPSEYLNSWLVESYWEHLGDAAKNHPLLEAWLHSRMMGAFGISVSTLGWSPEFLEQVAKDIKEFKSFRAIIADGNIYHLLPQPDLLAPDPALPNEPDAIEFYEPQTKQGIVFLFRGNTPWPQRLVLLQGLDPETTYQVDSADGAISVKALGSPLMAESIIFPYEEEQPSSLLRLTPVTTEGKH